MVSCSSSVSFKIFPFKLNLFMQQDNYKWYLSKPNMSWLDCLGQRIALKWGLNDGHQTTNLHVPTSLFQEWRSKMSRNIKEYNIMCNLVYCRGVYKKIWNDKLNIYRNEMFVYPHRILVELSDELVSNTYRLVSFPYSIFLHTKDYISYPAWILLTCGLTRYRILINFNIPYSEIVFDISRISYRSSSPFPAPTKSKCLP